MNEKIKELAEQTFYYGNWEGDGIFTGQLDLKKFAELIVAESCRALNPMLRDMISRGQGVDLIKKHFGVEE